MTLIAFMALAGLAGCARTELPEGEGGGFTDKGTNYLAFNIVSNGGVGTRAWGDGSAGTPSEGDFAVGSSDENAVFVEDGSYAFFFNSDNSFHSIVKLGNDSFTYSDITDRYDDVNSKEVSVGTFVANIKIDAGQSAPKKVLVVLNARPARIVEIEEDFTLKSKEERKLPNGGTPANDLDYILSRLTRELNDTEIAELNASVVLYTPGDGEGGKTNYCTMSNAVYVGPGDKEGDLKFDDQRGDIYDVTEIADGKICSTADEAKKPENVLTIHVERLAVKVETTIAGIDGMSADDGKWSTDKMDVQAFGGKGNKLYPEDDKMRYPIVMKPKKADGVTDKVPQASAGGTGLTDSKSVDWAFAMLGWSVNATARRTYLFKNLDDFREDVDGKKDAVVHHNDFEGEKATRQIKEPFFANWNDARHARCYWAVDGRYADASIYPVQYRKALDNTNKATSSFVGKYDGEKDGSPLYYYTFEQLRKITMGFSPNADVTSDNYERLLNGRANLLGNTRYRYCPENVLGKNLLAGNTYLGASTHVIIIGQLLLGDEIGEYEKKAGEVNAITEELLNQVHDKYYAAGCYWDREGYMQYAYNAIYKALTIGGHSINDIFGGTGHINTPPKRFSWYYKGSDGIEQPLSSEYMKDLAASLDLNDVQDRLSVDGKFSPDGFGGPDDDQTENIFRLVRAKTTNGDGRVMLGLKDGYTLVLKGYNEGNTAPVADVNITQEQFLSIVYEFANVADYYKNGRMYYYTPIRHLNPTKTGAPTELGEVGIVRNHWYKLTIGALLKPGIPVAEPEQPIIPNIDPADQYLALDIHILPWHVIGQTIELQ